MKYKLKRMKCICGSKVNYEFGICANKDCLYDFCVGIDHNQLPWVAFTINDYRVIYDYTKNLNPLKMEVRVNDSDHNSNFDRLILELNHHIDHNSLLKRLKNLKALE